MKKNKAKSKPGSTPWYTKIVNLLHEQNMELPVITGVYKGDRSVKITPTIKQTLLRQMEIIRTSNPRRYQIITDVQRAAITIGTSLLYELEVNNASDLFGDVCEEEDKFTVKMIALDDFVRIMHKMHSCWQKKVFDNDDIENMKKYKEIQDKHVSRMDEIGLGDQAREKLKQIKSGEKITNLMECKMRGGDKVSDGTNGL